MNANREAPRLRVCPSCKIVFIAFGKKLYCSDECGYKGLLKSNREREAKKRHGAAPEVPDSRPCAYCGKAFDIQSDRRRVYCSRECSAAARAEQIKNQKKEKRR